MTEKKPQSGSGRDESLSAVVAGADINLVVIAERLKHLSLSAETAITEECRYEADRVAADSFGEPSCFVLGHQLS
jgi:hypothetical protein